jgi:ferrochelatase
MHEQSETLAELDIDLRGIAEAEGLDFRRVPVPHDDPRLPGVLADLVESAIEENGTGPLELFPCRCKPDGGVRCLNRESTAVAGGDRP